MREFRRDKFDESAMVELMRQYSVSVVFQYGYTRNVLLMKSVKNARPVAGHVDLWNAETKDRVLRDLPPGNFAFVSHRSTVPDDYKALLKKFDFRLIFSREVASDTESDYSNLTHNGTNGLYINIYQKQAKRS